MKTEELKENIKLPVLGLGAVLCSMAVFILVLYLLAIAICVLAAL